MYMYISYLFITLHFFQVFCFVFMLSLFFFLLWGYACIVGISKVKGRKLCFITDCLPAGGLPYGEYTLGGSKIIYRDIVCRLEDGTVAGSVLHLNQGVWNVYTNSSIPLYECVNCASLNPATTLGIADRKGSLDVGKDADIVITDADFNIKKTIIGGEIRYEA